MRRNIALVVPTLTLLACRPEAEVVAARLDLPISPDDRSMVLAVHLERENETRLSAQPVTSAGIAPVTLSFELDAPISVTALLYSRPLEALFLEAGELERPSPGAPARPLPFAQRIFEGRVEGGAVTPFARAETLSELVAAVRISGRRCTELEEHTLPLLTQADARFVVGIGQGALVGLEDGGLRFVTRGGPVEIQGRSDLHRAFVAASGVIWFGAEQGKVVHGRLEPYGCTNGVVPCQQLVTREIGAGGTSETLMWIAGSPEPPDEELLALTAEGHLFRVPLTGTGTVALIHSFPIDKIGAPGPHADRAEGGLAWVGPGHVVAGFTDSLGIVRYRANATPPLREEFDYIMQTNDNGFSGVAEIPGLGTVVGTYDGQVYTKASADDREWRVLEGKTGKGDLLAFVPYRDGFFYVDYHGELAEWSPSTDFCPVLLEPGHAVDGTRDITVVGSDVVATRRARAGSDTGLRWLMAK